MKVTEEMINAFGETLERVPRKEIAEGLQAVLDQIAPPGGLFLDVLTNFVKATMGEGWEVVMAWDAHSYDPQRDRRSDEEHARIATGLADRTVRYEIRRAADWAVPTERG